MSFSKIGYNWLNGFDKISPSLLIRNYMPLQKEMDLHFNKGKFSSTKVFCAISGLG